MIGRATYFIGSDFKADSVVCLDILKFIIGVRRLLSFLPASMREEVKIRLPRNL